MAKWPVHVSPSIPLTIPRGRVYDGRCPFGRKGTNNILGYSGVHGGFGDRVDGTSGSACEGRGMTQPSGWYDDPSDHSRLRYWDGILWTDRTVPKQSPTAADSTIGRAVDPYAASSHHAPTGPGPGPYPPAAPTYGQPPTPYGQAPTPYGQPPAGRDYGAAPTYPWRPSGPTTPDGVPLAQWWQRLVAAVIDNIIVQLASLVLAFPWWRDFLVWYLDFLQTATVSSGSVDPLTLFGEINTEMARYIVPIVLIQSAVTFGYHVLFLHRNGASVGKLALGIRVRRFDRPGPLTLLEASRRQALQLVFGLVGLVPFIGMVTGVVGYVDVAWLLWDQRRQCLHDKIADTLVEQKPPTRRV